jgi:hypothetical protein
MLHICVTTSLHLTPNQVLWPIYSRTRVKPKGATNNFYYKHVLYNSEELPLAACYLASGYSEMVVLFLHLLLARKLLCGEGIQIQVVRNCRSYVASVFSSKALFDLFQVK